MFSESTNNALQIIGCGDAFASGGNFHTCFHLRSGETNILIDCGATTLHGLRRLQIDPDQIDIILISHLHGDHYAGIPFLLMDAAVRKRQRKLKIITPNTGKARIKALLQLLYPGSDKTEQLPVEYIEYKSYEILQLDGIQVQAYPVVHSKAALSHGLRITIGHQVLSYSGDTSWTDNLIPLSDGADLFICECNFYNTSTPTHMNYLDLVSKISQLNFNKILLTHLSEEMLANLDRVDIPVAKDGMTVSF
ncbi:hypothetical protein PBAL39_16199 [Pedobacter sp. BAL39]|uniref:MBL fold metallo-hydrolase n=1 Tax=Pedobacter sp. BAL39 TaxID=391596 RepID=UPI00015593C8|nr:MBL fold metallo-hydrolase [Pedobacter sp. BAL39]EDM37983.1 hypothetical protein PBAL39_16199 [Pedobacter sp. BAL39]